ncbi:TRAP dicarboxylate transporter subunit DctP [Gracilibacillus halophilus YIM-C55.5]|uniref:TRAP dicarboxylate transporter subunit DctP n=1 Tax=Gracilibacillus halophilus YIM-C55.5 TaxID=1308866 RepID=N4WSK7_9BACI|nr:TRAP transporter substrate-binding protein [Gracilibacillus halophilus]ENH96141.1 TRAP dicarboxylate transporter subunit DctP [Gracilibacillus halophilus YIM-C55.5]
MKKIITIALLGLLMTVLVACGGGESSNGDGSGDDSDNSGNNGEGNGEQASEEISIDFGHGSAETNVRHEAAVKFKELVEEESDGSITVNIYPNETLGSEPEMIENVSLNTLDMALAGAGIFTQYDDKIGAMNLPYLFDSYEHAWNVLDGEVGNMISEPLLDDNIRLLSFFENGMRHVTNSSQPIEEPSDLEGLTIRTPESDVSLNTLEAMGASSTPMAFGELYLALQQGTVDGQENPLANIHASNFFEVQDYVSMTGHQYGTLPLAVSDEFWQSLSSEQQTILQDAADEAGQFHREAIRDGEEELLEELKAEGMEVNTPDKAPFREATQDVVDNYAEVTSQEFMDKFLEEVEAARE